MLVVPKIIRSLQIMKKQQEATANKNEKEKRRNVKNRYKIRRQKVTTSAAKCHCKINSISFPLQKSERGKQNKTKQDPKV